MIQEITIKSAPLLPLVGAIMTLIVAIFAFSIYLYEYSLVKEARQQYHQWLLDRDESKVTNILANTAMNKKLTQEVTSP